MNIDVTSFEPAADHIRTVRNAVFGDEQGVARDLDWDGADPRCTHVLAVDACGRPVGTGRVQADGRIGRLAVLAPWRGRGVGSRMLAVLVQAARERGVRTVYLHAQLPAVAFYERNGFERAGAEFTEAGIQHVNMTRATQSRTDRQPG